MKSARCVVAALPVLLACGRFEAITEPGAATLSGCLVEASGSAAADVPVFLTTAGVATHETRSDARGCFSMVVPSGLHFLVANDFRGHGLVEPVTLYAQQRLALGTRTTGPLQFDGVLPTLRGVGSGERLGAHNSLLLDCDHSARHITLCAGDELIDLDVETGEVRSTTPAFTLRSERAADGQKIYRITDALGLEVEPPEDRWGWAVSAGGAFLGRTDRAYNSRTFYGTPSGLTEVSWGARLLLDGSIIEDHRDGGLTRRTPTETAHRRIPGSVETAGTEWLVVAEATGEETRAWRVRLDDTAAPTLLGAWPGTATGMASPGQLFLEHDGGLTWLALDEHGQADAAPLTLWPGQLVPQRDPTLVWASASRDGGALEFEVTAARIEAGQVGTRRTRVPAAEVPNNAYSWRDDFIWFPGFSLVGQRGGLEAFATGGALYLVPYGTPLTEARRFAALSLSNEPLCLVGNSLLVLSTKPDRTSEILRYDVRRIFDELGRTP